jgi:Dehydrogenases with different specificities (related to short-chain alcohol dehydrogenases)
MARLANKVALITGGARGMGASHVRRFVEEGAKVYFTDILVEDGEKLSEELGDNAVFLKHDVSSEADWKSVLDRIDNDEKKLDVLVNNAGIAPNGLIGDLSLDLYNKVIAINQVSVFLSLTHALPLLKNSGKASVVNISSLGGLKGMEGNAAYGSSKYAIRGLTQVAALEFAPFNIRVNSVHPGMVKTPMFAALDELPNVEEVTSAIPLKRVATPEELTNVVLFLASDESSYCTAGEFVVDGGLLTR